MNNLFDISLVLKEGPITSTFSLCQILNGKITIKPKKRVQVEYIGYHLMADEKKEHSFSTGPLFSREKPDYSKPLATKYLDTNKLLSEHEPYKYSFSFINSQVGSYTGINTTIAIRVEVFIKVNKKATRDMEASLLDKINPSNRLPKDGIYRESFYLLFDTTETDYKITSTSSELDLTATTSLTIPFLLAGFAILLFVSNGGPFIYAIIIVFVLLTLATGLYFWDRIMGDFYIKYEQLDKEAFLCKITNSKNWRYVKKMFVSYEIREVVIYESGGGDTSSTDIYEEILYKSANHLIKEPKEIISIKNEFPTEDILGTTDIGDSSITWFVCISIQTTGGVTLSHETEFIVKHVKTSNHINKSQQLNPS